jgi:hypothetical protein
MLTCFVHVPFCLRFELVVAADVDCNKVARALGGHRRCMIEGELGEQVAVATGAPSRDLDA